MWRRRRGGWGGISGDAKFLPDGEIGGGEGIASDYCFNGGFEFLRNRPEAIPSGNNIIGAIDRWWSGRWCGDGRHIAKHHAIDFHDFVPCGASYDAIGGELAFLLECDNGTLGGGAERAVFGELGDLRIAGADDVEVFLQQADVFVL